MKKKLLCIFIVVNIVAMQLAGCGFQKKKEVANIKTNDVVVEETTEEPDEVAITETEGEEKVPVYKWKTQKVGVPSFPDASRKETSINESITVTTATTFLGMKLKNIKDEISQIEYVSNSFILAMDRKETIKAQSFLELGDRIVYTITDSLGGKLKEKSDSTDYVDLNITLQRNTEYYDNYNKFTFILNEAPSYEMQEHTYDIMQGILPEEIAEYLVYGADDQLKDKAQLETEVLSSDQITQYTLKRELYESMGSGYVKYEIIVKDLDAENNSMKYYDGGYSSIQQTVKYSLSDILPWGMGSLNIKDYSNLLNKYMQLTSTNEYKYEHTILDVVHIENVVGDDGINKIGYYLAMRKSTEGIILPLSPKTVFEITIVEKDGAIIGIEYKFEDEAGYTSIIKEEELIKKSELVKTASKKLITLFPGLDVSEVDYSNFVDGNLTGNQIVRLLGKDISLDYSVSTGINNIGVYYSSFKVKGTYTN